ncbi:hypothetical protein A2856_01985 [Candidatus Uhrbacteria bacterium RIFCSPHIGHO2_01_FULL_63_20]|uniref:EfeO-type cupredoxin-like domain-containing protein n=1 Tax=Candidatus Uhrbacteria bacterium RIFCSPHIGHO2_01_FULL_63_20 TaxID=1802385 RepID=A0A1F7TKD2_9BACT|nr:MAG: hypothetical protein A2856_01985 [Candidatus Uhrbacteria bacterium RIFCSPHIGHO2_01_FULL_63_20]
MTNTNDRLFPAIVAVLALLAGFYAYSATSATGTDASRAEGGSPSIEAPLQAPPEAEKVVEETPKPPAAPKPLTYQGALELYGDRRIQFVSCHGTPGSMVLGKGAKFMLDNRDKKAHTVKVGTTAYKLGALNFAIATAREVGTFNVTCDGAGAATIQVQP